MVARSKKDIQKAHALNKRVRKEKARLRKRVKSHKARKYVWINISGLDFETMQKLEEGAKEARMSVPNYMRKILKNMMAVHALELLSGDNSDGI